MTMQTEKARMSNARMLEAAAQVPLTEAAVLEPGKVYDLEDRTALFGEACIRFARSLRRDEITRPLVTQLIRSSTSVGANYCEADDAESHKDFRHKIGICKKEARESKHWLRMIATACPDKRDEAASLSKEAKELNLIFASIRLKGGRR